MSAPIPPHRPTQIQTILNLAAQGECVAIFGLSNTGKSPFLRSLPHATYLQTYAHKVGRSAMLVYIDCNRVVELTTQGFYEVVLRALLETLEFKTDRSARETELLTLVREQHSRVIAATTPFQSSLAFNHALSETCHVLEQNVLLLLDEFDEVYAALDERALVNLRALKDKFQSQLVYVTATVRPLADSRKSGDNEFAELFAVHSLPLGMLTVADMRAMAQTISEGNLSAATLTVIEQLAGGHFGLLTALTQTALRLTVAQTPLAPEQLSHHLANDPNTRAECLKVWNQLHTPEQEALKALITEAEEGLPERQLNPLKTLGLVNEAGEIFSPVFITFVRRQCAAPAQEVTGIVVDDDAGEVWVDGERITVLTDLEYKLMRLLHQRNDRLTTKDMIVETVWGGQYFDKVDDARIEKLVSRLRAKIEADPTRPRYLLTQRGRGYKLASHPHEAKADEGE